MRTDRTNLLVSKRGYSDILKYFKVFRISLLIMTIVILLFAFIAGYLIFLQSQELEKLTQEKQKNLQLLSTKKEDEVKLIKIANKTQDLETFSKDDANFYPYYEILNQSFSLSTESAYIENLNIEKDRKFNFSISFTDIKSLLETFKFIESENFLKNFSTIYLKSLETQDKQEVKFYRITFEGVFKEIDENKN